jgi:hypothetical protein
VAVAVAVAVAQAVAVGLSVVTMDSHRGCLHDNIRARLRTSGHARNKGFFQIHFNPAT